MRYVRVGGDASPLWAPLPDAAARRVAVLGDALGSPAAMGALRARLLRELGWSNGRGGSGSGGGAGEGCELWPPPVPPRGGGGGGGPDASTAFPSLQASYRAGEAAAWARAEAAVQGRRPPPPPGSDAGEAGAADTTPERLGALVEAEYAAAAAAAAAELGTPRGSSTGREGSGAQAPCGGAGATAASEAAEAAGRTPTASAPPSLCAHRALQAAIAEGRLQGGWGAGAGAVAALPHPPHSLTPPPLTCVHAEGAHVHVQALGSPGAGGGAAWADGALLPALWGDNGGCGGGGDVVVEGEDAAQGGGEPPAQPPPAAHGREWPVLLLRDAAAAPSPPPPPPPTSPPAVAAAPPVRGGLRVVNTGATVLCFRWEPTGGAPCGFSLSGPGAAGVLLPGESAIASLAFDSDALPPQSRGGYHAASWVLVTAPPLAGGSPPPRVGARALVPLPRPAQRQHQQQPPDAASGGDAVDRRIEAARRRAEEDAAAAAAAARAAAAAARRGAEARARARTFARLHPGLALAEDRKSVV